jgi:hypothetical protein
MPRLPAAINWIKGSNIPGDLLMTLIQRRYHGFRSQEQHYSKVMSFTEVRDFFYAVVNNVYDNLELQTISQKVWDENGDETGVDVERLVPNPASPIEAIFFQGSDRESEDGDEGFKLNDWRMPDADLEADRNRSLAIIDKYLSAPDQVSLIKCYQSDSSVELQFAALRPIDLDEFFGLE